MYKDNSVSAVPIKGEWKTPPLYENLKNGISQSIEQSISKEKEKYR